MTTYRHIDTKLIHAGEPEPRILGAVSMPIFQSAMFEYAGETDYHDIKYIRLNNTPNHAAVHQKLMSLENAEAALVTSSGMAAISTALLTVLKAGDHLLVQDCLYGGTHDFVTKDLESFGIAFDFVDGDDPTSWKKGLKPMARLVSYGIAGVDPKIMGIGPVPASKKALEKAGLKVEQMDVVESNEAFAVQALAVNCDLKLDAKKTNPNGGAVGLGHPIGATGAVLTVKALYELQRVGGQYALVTMCIGGGQGIAAIYERL